MIIVMMINLFTVRYVFIGLGNEDYGIYNVIAGVVLMFNSVISVLSSSTQRFFSYSMGSKQNKLSDIFSVSMNIFFLLSLFILVIGETIGLWFINNKLHIPVDRILAANITYQFSLISLVISLLQTPYLSAIISHEDMNIYAYVSIFDSLIKLVISVILVQLIIDRLVFYSTALVLLSTISLLLYRTICKKKYIECHISKVQNRSLYNSILSFSGWHLFSSFAGIGMIQINTILVNIFFGVIANAARAVSLQIQQALTSFAGGFIMAVRPAMIKAYANQDYQYLNRLFNYCNKFVYYFMLIIILPLYIEMDNVLQIWLGTIDIQTILFSRLIVIYTLIVAINNPISIIMQATGKVKEYFLLVESFTLMCPILTYIFYKFDYNVEVTYYIMIATIVIAHIVRVHCLYKYYEYFELSKYLKSFLFPAIVVTFISYIFSSFMKNLYSDSMLIIIFSTAGFIIALSVIVGLSKSERIELFNKIINRKI